MNLRVARKVLCQKAQDDIEGHSPWYRYTRVQCGAALRRSLRHFSLEHRYACMCGRQRWTRGSQKLPCTYIDCPTKGSICAQG